MAAFLATHDLRVITCNGGEATPSYMRKVDIGGFIVGKGTQGLNTNNNAITTISSH